MKKPVENLMAAWLKRLVILGFFSSIVVFGIYTANLLPTRLGPRTVAESWHLSAREFVRLHDLHPRWGWPDDPESGGYRVSLAAPILLAAIMPLTLLFTSICWFLDKNIFYGTLSLILGVLIFLTASGVLN